jgi:hypothetical protein
LIQPFLTCRKNSTVTMGALKLGMSSRLVATIAL